MHDEIHKMTWGTTVDSVQPGHPPSMNSLHSLCEETNSYSLRNVLGDEFELNLLEPVS